MVKFGAYLVIIVGNLVYSVVQVYHHCLARTRYDFLCANFTAFDQRTFICHFVSEIDCANSKKYWHRNDALYKATTTMKPLVIHTPPPQTTAVPAAPINPSGPGQRRPIGGRRPFRRRPQFDYYDDDYYDDYYEERPRANRGRKRPRPRPRPVYDDEYDGEYEDERYERRGGGRRNEKRRPYERRPGGKRRNQDRVKHDYEEDADGLDEDDYKNSRRKTNGRKTYDDDSEEGGYPESRKQNKRRPIDEDSDEDNEKRPKKNRRPINDDYEDDTFQRDDSRSYSRPRKNEERRTRPKEEPKLIIKPVSGTIYDRPRVAPRIKRPVPKDEANKYAYKPVASTQPVVEEEPEYYDDYEDTLPKRKNNRPELDSRRTASKNKNDSRRESSTKGRQRPRRPEETSYEGDERPRYKETRPRSKPVSDEYYDYEEYEDEDEEQKTSTNKSERREKSSTTSTTTTTTEKPEKIKQPLVRLVKRPFLPSRGGNPYAPRGLQPVGARARKPQNDEQSREVLEESSGTAKGEATVEQQPKFESDEIKPLFKPSPVMINVPVRPKLSSISSDSFRTQSINADAVSGSRTTPKTKLPERNPLDINEEEYDVTLNDALNPTLPNVPVPDSPAEFVPNNDYMALGNYQRSRYVLEPVASQTGSDYVYQNKPVVARDRPVSSDIDYNGQYNTYRETYRPRRVQQRTEALYSRY